MLLKIMSPTEIVVNEKVHKVIAEGENGSFCLKERHVDFVSALVPGLLSFISETGEEVFVALDEGLLVKCGDVVFVSARNALRGPDLGMLKDTVEKEFRIIDEKQKKARDAVVKLEANLVRKFIELGENMHE